MSGAKGLHRHEGTARISDGVTFRDLTEQQYRDGGYTPDFDELPTLMVQRVSAPVGDESLCEDDRRWIEEWTVKNAPRPTKEEIAKMSEQELYDTFGTRYPKNSN